MMFYACHINKIKRIFFGLLLVAGGCFLAVQLVNHFFPITHMAVINQYAKQYDLEPAFVCAVIHAESKFQKDAISPKGASGLMQLTQPTAMWLAEKMGIKDFTYEQIHDPEINIAIGCYNLRRLLNKFGNDTTLALAAYNAGEGNVSKWLASEKTSSDGVTLDSIPFKETREYVKRVSFNTKVYEKILAIWRYKQ